MAKGAFGDEMPSKKAMMALADKHGIRKEWAHYREELVRAGTPRPDAYRAAYVRFLKPLEGGGGPELGDVLGAAQPKGDATASAGSPNAWRPKVVGDEDLTEAQQIRWAAESLGHFRASGELPTEVPSKGCSFWFDFGLRYPDKFAGHLQKESQRSSGGEDGEIIKDGRLRIDELDERIATLQHAAVQPCPEGSVEEPSVPA